MSKATPAGPAKDDFDLSDYVEPEDLPPICKACWGNKLIYTGMGGRYEDCEACGGTGREG